MRNLYAIYRKEMRHYFVSPVAYVCIGLFLLLSAVFFNFFLSAVIQQSFQMEMQSMQFGMPPQFDVPGQVRRAFLGLLSTLILFITPFLTMGIFAEERKRGTMELLMTSPISEIQIVLGKFFAALSLFAVMLLPTAGYLVYMYLHSDPVPAWRHATRSLCWNSAPRWLTARDRHVSSRRSPKISSSLLCSLS